MRIPTVGGPSARHHWLYQTVEWNLHVAQIQSYLNNHHVTHYVLPDLPEVYSPQDVLRFDNSTPPQQRIYTIAASRHDATQHHTTLTNAVKEAVFHKGVDKLLIVGGNNHQAGNTKQQLSTVDAVQVVKDVLLREHHHDDKNHKNIEIWGVANPNDETSVDGVQAKINAGMTGFITQPLLVSHAMETLNGYPRHFDDTRNITYIAGMALPKTTKGLLFWMDLVLGHQSRHNQEGDSLFRDHCAYFDDTANKQQHDASLTWAQHQLATLQHDATNILGVHYMPLRNTDDLISLLKNNQQQEQPN